ncbi:MAG: glycosyltransferase family 9 protein [Myxococcales bacterium]|nr:glycosyltransferase family 9 protein [Myxococcales bacterium]
MRAVVISTAFLGDVIFTAPLVDNLLAAGFAVDLVARPGYGELLATRPGVTPLPFDKRGADAGLAGLLRLGARLRARRPGLVLGAHPSTRSGLLAALTGAPRRLGWGPVGYHQRVPRGPRFVEDARALGVAAGIPDVVARPGRRPGPAAPGLPAGAPIALVPGSRVATKRWPTAHWRTLAAGLRAAGHPVCWLGGPGEAGLAADDGPGVFDATLPATAALLARCAAAVGGDSGLLHLARAVGTPVVMLFGPTGSAPHPADPGRLDVERADLPCRPCSPHGPPRCPLGHHACLAEVLPATVLAAVETVLHTPDRLGRTEVGWPTASRS